jgi:7TMR-DISM extracellular 2.
MPRDAEQYPQLTRDFDDAVIERPVLGARRAFRHALSILLILWLGPSTVQAASTLRIEVARDPTGQATLSDMLTADAPWEPLDGLYSGGYTEAALWFWFPVKRDTHDNARHILCLHRTPLDQLTLYGVSATGL